MTRQPTISTDSVAQVAEFVRRYTPAWERWRYAGEVLHRSFDSYRIVTKALPGLGRFLGVAPDVVTGRLRALDRHGDFNRATDYYRRLRRWPEGADPFAVAPIEPWLVGHVYFARPVRFPHIVKVGFSRRVQERIEDIGSKVGQRMEVRPNETRVAVGAEEHWWHDNWRNHRIVGEWFFDPQTSDRTLPPFLANKVEPNQIPVVPGGVQVQHAGEVH